MNIVVVGGTGFIGSHVTDALLAGGHTVKVYCRSHERYRQPLNNVEYVDGDLADQPKLCAALAGADVVVHLASATIPQTSNESPKFDIESNLVGTIGLLDACVHCSVGRVVYTSSGGTVYGNPESIPVLETHPTNPTSSYGIVKLAIEKYLALYKELHGLDYVVLRPSNAYGERQNPLGNLGAVTVFLGKVARDQPITVWGDGEISRDFVYVKDLAKACVSAVDSRANNLVLNIGSGTGTSLNSLIEVIRATVGRPVIVHRKPPRLFDVPKRALSTEKARQYLNWVPETTLEDGVARTWKWIQSLA